MLSLLFRAGSGQRTAQSGTVPQQQASGSNVQIAHTDAGNAKQSCPSVQRASDFSLEKLGGKIDGSGACEIVMTLRAPLVGKHTPSLGCLGMGDFTILSERLTAS